MSNYYKLRQVVMHKTKNWLEIVEESKQAGNAPPPYTDFRRRMMLDYGVTDKMLVKAVEALAPGATIKNNEVVPE